ncbi:MAG: ATP-binding protein [Phycisphaerae bacterium]
MTLKTSTHEKLVLKGIISELRKVCSKVLCHAQQFGYSSDDLFAMHLAMEEALVNAVKHGNKRDMNKNIAIEYDVTPEKIDVSVTDQGHGFNPDNVEDPRCGDNIYKTGGRGVLLMKSYMDEVEYNETGNSVHMVKFNSKLAR